MSSAERAGYFRSGPFKSTLTGNERCPREAPARSLLRTPAEPHPPAPRSFLDPARVDGLSFSKEVIGFQNTDDGNDW
jgi:hypothetical protein